MSLEARPETKKPDAREAAKHQPRKNITKVSIGILLCRINGDTRRTEVAMVHKRYTYEFSEFVHGRYSRNHIRTITGLLERMTADELLDIYSLKFDQLWYRIWLSAEKTELYTKKLSKFHMSFIKTDGGVALQQLVKQVQGSGEPLWEPPGGKKLSVRETDIMCAIREVAEETGVKKKWYKIIPGVRKRMSFTHMGVRYVKVYYVALAHQWLARQELSAIRSVGTRAAEQTAEVSEARWMDIIQVRSIDTPSKRLANLVEPIFRLVKSYVAGKRAGGTDTERLVSTFMAMPAPVSEKPPAPATETKWTVVKSRKRSEKKDGS